MSTSELVATLISGLVIAAPPLVRAPNIICPTPEITDPVPVTVKPRRSA